MNIFQWLKKQGYEYTWNVRIGTKTPDILAFKDKELIVFEIKRYATEISKNIKECSFYLQNANKVYVILPLKEIKKIQTSSLNLLKKYGIGLIQANKDVKVLLEPRFSSNYNKKIMKTLNNKSLSRMIFNHRRKSIEKEIKNVLDKHSEGLSITDISKLLKLHRHTVVKYTHQLTSAGIAFQRKIGPVKLCYLKKYFKNSKVVE